MSILQEKAKYLTLQSLGQELVLDGGQRGPFQNFKGLARLKYSNRAVTGY